MMKSKNLPLALTLARYILLAVLATFNVTILILSSSLMSIEGERNAYNPVVIYLVFLGAFSSVFLIPLIIVDLFSRKAAPSKILFELSWLVLLWIMHLAAASALTGSPPCAINDACGSIQSALIGFEWLTVAILLIHLSILFISTLARMDSHPQIWTMSVRDVEWFSAGEADEKITARPTSRGHPDAPPGSQTTSDRRPTSSRTSWRLRFPQQNFRSGPTNRRGHDPSNERRRAPAMDVSRAPFSQEPYPFAVPTGALSPGGESVDPNSQLSPTSPDAGPSHRIGAARDPVRVPVRAAFQPEPEPRVTSRQRRTRRVPAPVLSSEDLVEASVQPAAESFGTRRRSARQTMGPRSMPTVDSHSPENQIPEESSKRISGNVLNEPELLPEDLLPMTVLADVPEDPQGDVVSPENDDRALHISPTFSPMRKGGIRPLPSPMSPGFQSATLLDPTNQAGPSRSRTLPSTSELLTPAQVYASKTGIPTSLGRSQTTSG